MKFYYLLFLVVLSVIQQAGSSCVDKHRKCTPSFKMYCNYRQYRTWMERNCPKLCNVCQDLATWSSWSVWSGCSASCGDGTKSRARTCSVSGKCEGDNQQTNKCDLPKCENWKCPEEGLNTRGRSQLGTATKTDSWEECAAKCAKEKDCELWTWVKTTGGAYQRNCALMSAAQKTVHDGNVISGVKTCQEPCLTSPNYPSNYSNNANKAEKLSVPAGKGIEITFKDLDLETSDTGCYDYLEFLDGNGKLVSKICGSSIAPSITIESSTATVNFRSDESVTKRGYQICYKPVSLATKPIQNKSCLCGLAKRQKTRIVGGTETGVNEYPWLVALIVKDWGFQGGKKATGQCGGTLINDRWVLTAAHCVAWKSWPYGSSWKNRTMDMVKVVLGQHDWSDKIKSISITRNVIQMEKHKSYDFDMDYDLTLLKIDPPVDFALHEHIRPACLPQTENTGPEPDSGMAGDWATVAGWGHTKSGGGNSDVTQHVNVVVQTSQKCKEDYKELIAKKRAPLITDRMFCASVEGGGKDSCQNDSGGPIIWAKGDGVTAGQNYEVKGVVSFGYGCARAGMHGVYAKVSYVLPWIKSVTKDGTFCPRT